ncbi:MAG TPA: ester cyclase [Bryobacteraceae bacterium]
MSVQTPKSDEVILDALAHLNNGNINSVIAYFASEFHFRDYGLGLEFTGRERLAEFFRKIRELYPDSLVLTDHVFVSGNHVIAEWTLRATLTEPFYGGLTRNISVSVHGASIVRIYNGEITDWSDFYDGLTSRRAALAAHFEEWVEL